MISCAHSVGFSMISIGPKQAWAAAQTYPLNESFGSFRADRKAVYD